MGFEIALRVNGIGVLPCDQHFRDMTVAEPDKRYAFGYPHNRAFADAGGCFHTLVLMPLAEAREYLAEILLNMAGMEPKENEPHAIPECIQGLTLFLDLIDRHPEGNIYLS